jgi:alanine racemase
MESYLTAEISASAIRANLGLLRQQLSPAVKLCAVVKADCYGHGLDVLLPVIARGADFLAVATAEEAIHLRRLGYDGPVLMLFSACACANGQQRAAALPELVARHVTLTVVAPAEVAAVARAGELVGAAADVHVMIDTGMTRSGIAAAGAADLVGRIRRDPHVRLTGLYTHFASADEADKTFTKQQLERFLAVVDACGPREGLTLHAANSAATIDLPETHLDMVRPGIAIYGYPPSRQMHTRLPLQPSLRLTGCLMQIRDVAAGSRCGYGLTYTFTRPSRVGLVGVGYADGYLRCLSNRTTMRVRGRDVPARGRVSMDQVILDLTDVEEAEVGDEVEIISPDPDAPHSVVGLAALADTIPYEITCLLGRRVRRVLVD